LSERDLSRPLSTFLRQAADRLRGIGAGNPRLEAEYLAAHALGVERIDLFRRHDEEPLPSEAAERLEQLLRRRLAREPLQYVLGNVPFCDLLLEVGPGTLIPRSETEILVERVVEAAREMTAVATTMAEGRASAMVAASASRSRPPLLIDIGTGSGAILLACLHRLPGWRGFGTDPSAAAMAWARRNRDALKFDDRAALLRGDLCQALRPGSADFVVSNPPYIRREELADLAPEIREHEPREALDGGEDGLEVVRRLIPGAAAALRPGGWLALELAPDQPETVRALLADRGDFDSLRIFQDLAARPRGVLARRV